MATRYKSVEAAQLVPLESFQSNQAVQWMSSTTRTCGSSRCVGKPAVNTLLGKDGGQALPSQRFYHIGVKPTSGTGILFMKSSEHIPISALISRAILTRAS